MDSSARYKVMELEVLETQVKIVEGILLEQNQIKYSIWMGDIFAF